MPVVLHRRRDRRAFLGMAGLSGAALLASAFRHDTPASPPGGDLHLALLSDTHVPGDRVNGHRGMNPWENLRAAVAQVVAVRPAAVAICGDAARLEGREDDYRELRALLEPVAAVAPVYVAGLLGKAQRAWLAAYLPTVADRPAVILVHHPPSDEDGDLLDGDRLLAILRANPHVKAIVHGHAHVWALGRLDRLHIVSLPALGYNFDDTQPVGWVEARFRPNGVSLTLRAVAGNRADDGRTTLLEWDV